MQLGMLVVLLGLTLLVIMLMELLRELVNMLTFAART